MRWQFEYYESVRNNKVQSVYTLKREFFDCANLDIVSRARINLERERETRENQRQAISYYCGQSKSDLLRPSDLHRSTASECPLKTRGLFAETWNVPERMHKAHFTPPQFRLPDLTHRQKHCPHCNRRFFETCDLKKRNSRNNDKCVSFLIQSWKQA